MRVVLLGNLLGERVNFSLSIRYTHRVAISNHRLVSFAEGKVTFRWRDSAHNNEQKLLTLSLDEFLRRFLLHALRAHPQLRLPRRPQARRTPTTLLSSASARSERN
jgi:hypothetical protein